MLYAGDGSVQTYEDPLDFGLQDTARRFRRTTLTGCSCGFFTAFGGLPCRHMLLLYILQQEQSFPLELVCSKWRQLAVDEEHRLHEALHRTLRPRLITSAQSAPRAQSMTRNERYRLFVAEAKIAAELVCSKQADFDYAFDILQGVTQRVREGNLAEPEGHTRECELPQATTLPAAQGEDSAMVSKTDVDDLIETIGLQLEADAPPTEEQCETRGAFLGRYIAYKWGAKKTGGWWLGNVTEQFEGDNTYCVFYTGDNETSEHDLTFASHTSVT